MGSRILEYCPKPYGQLSVCGKTDLTAKIGTNFLDFNQLKWFTYDIKSACYYKINVQKENIELSEESKIQLEFTEMKNIKV